MQSPQELMEALSQLPKEIHDLQMSILNLNEEETSLAADISKAEAKIKSEIAAAVDANGKKLFSNAEMRDAELVERSSSDLDLITLKSQHDSVKRKITEARLEVELLNNQQRNARTCLDFIGATA